MKLKQQLAILTASLLLGACSAENLLDTQVPPTVEEDGTRREVMLTLKNVLKLKPADTRAGTPIATDEENYIESLDVYVFGSKEENGTYTFQELHYYRDDASEVTLPGVESYSFGLRAGGDKTTTNGLLKLKKGLFVKLYCVVNRTALYQTDAAGVATKFDGFKSLIQDKPGQADNTVTPGVPIETDFKKLHTKLIDPAVANPTADDVLAPSLPMTGAYTTPLDLTDFGTSARTQISFKLTRMVARFDVVNNAEESKFTIESISMGNGQSAAQFFPIETLVTDPDKLIVYPKRVIEATTQQKDDVVAGTTSTTRGAFYSWPSPKDDKGYLILSGKYAVNKTETVNVSYKVPFQQMADNIGTYIEVTHNHRYTISITKAEEYHLDFTLNVDDWDDAEELDRYEPDNSFDQTKTSALASGVGAYVQPNGLVSLLLKEGSQFGFEMGSNTALTDDLIFATGSEEWITKVAATPVTRASSMKTLYTYAIDDTKLADPKKLLPVTIRLTNPASGMRKEIKIIPTAGPKVSLVHDAGNYSKFDAATMTATMYNVAGQILKLHVVAETRNTGTAEAPVETTGSTAVVSESWLTASTDVATAEGDYTLTLGTKQSGSPLPSTIATFTSTASTAASKINVVLKSAAMTALVESDISFGNDGGTVNLTGGTGGEVSLNSVADNQVSISVTSPEGVTATVEGDWLELVGDSNNGVVTAKIKSDATGLDTAKTGGKITIANKLDATETIVIEVVTTVVTPPVTP